MSSCVTTRARPSVSSEANGGQTTSSRCEDDLHDAVRGPLLAHGGVRDRGQRRDAADAGGHPPRLGGARRDHDEVAAAQHALDEHVAHAGVAVLERGVEAVGAERGGREDREVRCAVRAVAGDLPRMARAAARARGDPPAVGRAPGAQRPLGLEAAADPGDGVARARPRSTARSPSTSIARGSTATRRSGSPAALRASTRSRRRWAPVAVAASLRALAGLQRPRAALQQRGELRLGARRLGRARAAGAGPVRPVRAA